MEDNSIVSPFKRTSMLRKRNMCMKFLSAFKQLKKVMTDFHK